MHWVWTHSRAKGNVRLVLLAVADKAPDAAATARMGTTEFRARLNAPKSTVVTAVDKALESGELVMVEPAAGSRAAVYQLPHAVGYARPAVGATGPETGPLGQNYRSGFRTPNSEQGSENRTPSETATGPDSGPGGSENETPRGPDSGPLNQTTPTRSESKQAREPDPADLGPQIPTNARPLVDALTASGVVVRWNLTTTEWFTVEALIKRTGIPALTAYAQKQAAAKDISYAKYFLPGWRELPPLPEQPAGPRPLRAVTNGWQPYQNPDPSVYQKGF